MAVDPGEIQSKAVESLMAGATQLRFIGHHLKNTVSPAVREQASHLAIEAQDLAERVAAMKVGMA